MGPRRILRAVLHCALLVPLVRPEEVFNTTPAPVRSNFSCYGRETGFYADVQANCKVYHTCDDYGNKFSYRCPEETAFRQDALICDHAHLVDCEATAYSEPSRRTNEKRESLQFGLPSFFKFGSLDVANPRRGFSRSFQVVQPPDKSTPKTQPGFVFSASVFLRDLEGPHSRGNVEGRETDGLKSGPTKPAVEVCGANQDSSRRSSAASTASSSAAPRRPPARLAPATTPPSRHDQRPAHSERTSEAPKGVSRATSASSHGNADDYPYLETLRSIQANARPASGTLGPAIARSAARSAARTVATTEIPVHALTLSLKPLVPNELEYDPYYPRFPTSTEAYYTPSASAKPSRASSPQPWTGVHFEIPAILPDLNSLEDLVDRRKFFYIPRLKPA